MKKIKIRQRGFTLIELIITFILAGIILIPVAFMTQEFMREIPYSRDLGIAEGLAKTEMAKINNLSYSDATLAVGYDNTTANYEGYPYNVRRTVIAGPIANTKQVQVRVSPLNSPSSYLINVITYIANITFGAGSGGGSAGGGGDSDFLTISGGSISGSNLQNITLENQSPSSITITGVIITFSGSNPGIKLDSITLGGSQRWNGNDGSPSTVTLTSSFSLTGSATYANTGTFAFSKNLGSVSSLVFVMSDGTQTPSYSW